MSKKNIYNRELWKALYSMYVIQGKHFDEIADTCGYSDPNVIGKVLESVEIHPGIRSDLYNSLSKIMLTDEQEQILLGSILGDGCVLDRTSRNPIYTETHSIHQLDYLNWKQTRLYPFVNKVTIGHKGVDAQIRSVALHQLKYYRKVFYPDDKKIVPVETLEWLDALAIAVWYMDDGSITKESGIIRIATCSFDMRTVGMLQGWFAAKYGILCYVRTDKGKYPTLVIQKESNDKFLKLVEPYIISSMRYKLGQV